MDALQIERDPNGLGMHDIGAKADAGKPKAGQILGMFANALMAVSKVGTFGAEKYEMGSWQHVENGIVRYDDAGERHRLYRKMGQEIDLDSGLPHIYHEAWNILAELELYIREGKNNG